MKKKEKAKKVTCRRLIYSIIYYLEDNLNYKIELSSYLFNSNTEHKEMKYVINQMSKYLAKKNNWISDNRLILTISIDDITLIKKQEESEILKKIFKNIRENFFQSNLLDLLESYEPETRIKIFTKNYQTTETIEYIIIIFNLPNKSSIEFVISTNRLGKKLLEKYEDGKVINYQKKLSENIVNFEKGRSVF